jgi:hypothetical protein
LQVDKSSEGTTCPKSQSLSVVKLFKRYKSLAKLSGKKLMNFLKKKESSNKSKLDNKKSKTEKLITNFLNGKPPDAMKSISIQVYTQNSNPNFTPLKPIDTLPKIFTKWDSRTCQWSEKKSESNPCSGLIISSDPEQSLS